MLEDLGDGVSLRTHLEKVYQTTGILPEELRLNLPEPFTYLWDFFLQLHCARGSNGFGPASINYHDILAWQTVTETQLKPFELRAILAMDIEYMKAISDQQKKKAKK
ncbi:MAG: hypothetical protein LUQ26_07325 [Methylococcaceae bacterium]|nr:hypothetical protein [Methylococcaceae bacterium]